MSELPLKISGRAAATLGEIERVLGNWEGELKEPKLPAPLQHANRIKDVFGTVALAGSGSSLQAATNILEGKRGPAAARDVLELENASKAYERLTEWDPFNKGHLLQAHGVLVHELSPDAGRFRSKPAQAAVQALLKRVRPGRDLPPILAAVSCHRELLTIRPFGDGNGRLARLWLRVMLRQAAPIFEHAPIEDVLLAHRSRYEAVLATASQRGTADAFLETLLELLLLALRQLGPQLRGQAETPDDRVEKARAAFGKRWFSRKDYLALFPKLSTASASRDLASAATSNTVDTRGERRFTQYRFG